MKHYAVVLGTRPNFVKAAPFFKRARNYPRLKFTLVHTGQHFDDNMSTIFFEQMGIPHPDHHLEITGQYHTEKIGRMFQALTQFFSKEAFDGVILFGDVNSTLAGAIAAMNNRLPVIHVEAGLRSHDRRMPEEINRVIIDHVSTQLFTSEPSGNKNLELEGINMDRVHFVGNIMIESLLLFRDLAESSSVLRTLELIPKSYVLATIHRQENTDDPHHLATILTILNKVNRVHPVIFPLHPGTHTKIQSYGLEEKLERLRVIPPQSYFNFMKLMMESCGVLTDSGGIQEETTFLGIPCATLRDNTERPITLTQGTNQLFSVIDMNASDILKHFDSVPQASPIEYWDDQVSRRILDKL